MLLGRLEFVNTIDRTTLNENTGNENWNMTGESSKSDRMWSKSTKSRNLLVQRGRFTRFIVSYLSRIVLSRSREAREEKTKKSSVNKEKTSRRQHVKLYQRQLMHDVTRGNSHKKKGQAGAITFLQKYTNIDNDEKYCR